MKMQDRRLGKIYISHRLMTLPTILSEAFSRLKLFPLDIRHEYYSARSEYIVYGPSLPILDEGVEIPEYQLEVTVDENGIIENIVLNTVRGNLNEY